jgi:hypothetical protein
MPDKECHPIVNLKTNWNNIINNAQATLNIQNIQLDRCVNKKKIYSNPAILRSLKNPKF